MLYNGLKPPVFQVEALALDFKNYFSSTRGNYKREGFMKKTHYTDIEPRQFDNEMVKGVSGRVLIGKTDGAENFCMRLFEVDPGGFSPRHSHEWEHEIFIHAGTGEVFNGSSWEPVTAGTAVFIPGNQEHQLKNTGDKPMMFLCLIPSGAPEL